MATGIHSRIQTNRQPSPISRWRSLMLAWRAVPPRRRTAILAGLGVLVILSLALQVHLALSRPSGLFPFPIASTELRDMSVELTRRGIPHELNPQKDNLLVTPGQQEEARRWLASCGLPRPRPDWVAPPKNMLPNGDEDELKTAELCERLRVDLRQFQGVADAVVQLTRPDPDRYFTPREELPTACVMITMQPNRRLEAGQVRSMRALVASSVRGLDPKNVEVVDHEGQAFRPDEGQGLQSELRRNIEETLAFRAQNFLNDVLGIDNAYVVVSVDLDYSEIEIRRKDVGGPEHFVVVQRRKEGETYNRNAEPQDEAHQLAAQPRGGNYEKIGEIQKTEVDENYLVKIDRMPRIQRISCSVALDDQYHGEREKVRTLVQGAVGYDESRGDFLAVETLALADAPPGTPDPPPPGVREERKPLELGAALLWAPPMVLSVLLGFLLMGHLRPRLDETPVQAGPTGIDDIVGLGTTRTEPTTAVQPQHRLDNLNPSKVAELLKSTWLS